MNNVMSKVAERIINKQLADHLEDRGLLSFTQHAYRKSKSCGSAWQDIDTFVSKALSEGKVCGLILTDQSAAFNVLMKEILLEKLPLYGLSSDACKLIGNYLDGRSTMCQVAGERSTLVKLSSGVPEGSILGPILYTLAQMCVPVVPRIVKERILKNESNVKIPERVTTDSVEYADDVTGLLSANDEEDFQEAVNTFMSEYSTFFSKCGLALNLSKCAVIVFRPGSKTKTITLDGQEEETHVKLLGLTVDNKYSFVKHALKVKSTVEYRLSCLRKILKYYNKDKRKQICQSLILSVVTYGLEFYGREEHLHGHIQVSLNRVARTVLDEAFDAEVQRMLHSLKWSNIRNLYYEALVSNLRRLILSKNSLKAYDMLDMKPSVYTTRFRELRHTWSVGWDNRWGKASFILTAIRITNQIGIHKVKDKSNNIFKNKLRDRVWSCYGNPNIKKKKK